MPFFGNLKISNLWFSQSLQKCLKIIMHCTKAVRPEQKLCHQSYLHGHFCDFLTLATTGESRSGSIRILTLKYLAHEINEQPFFKRQTYQFKVSWIQTKDIFGTPCLPRKWKRIVKSQKSNQNKVSGSENQEKPIRIVCKLFFPLDREIKVTASLLVRATSAIDLVISLLVKTTGRFGH